MAKTRTENDDGPLDDETPPVAVPKQPKPSRFHPRFLKAAEELGISDSDVEACNDNAELRGLIDFERQSIQAEQSRNRNRPQDRQQQVQQPVSPPPPPPAEPEWAFGGDMSHVDPAIATELKRLGVALLKSTKKGDKDRIDELREEIAELKKENEAIRAKDSPGRRRIDRTLAKYESLFGTQDDREAEPHGRLAMQFRWLDEYLTGQQEQGKLTGSPEKDISAAIAHLFPGAKPAGKEAPPEAQPKSNNGVSRQELWSDSGTPPTSRRNSVEQTGKPGGKKAAAAKIRAKMREDGYDSPDDSDPDDDEDI